MATAARPRPEDRAARPRPSASVLFAFALATCSTGAAAAAAVSNHVSVTFSSPARQAFAPQDVVAVTYLSPFARPLITTWCDPDSPRQESFQKAQPFSGQVLVPLSRIRMNGVGDWVDEKECWFNLGSLEDPADPGVNSESFRVSWRSGASNASSSSSHELELRDDKSNNNKLPTRTSSPHRNGKRASPNIPSPTAQQTSGPSGSAISCPPDNRTVYTEPVTAKRYVILCGRDYSSDFGAVDIRSRPAINTNDCIALCAADKTGCTAVGWGDYRGEFMCFMKKSIGQANFAPQWRVAVEDPSQRGTGAAPQGTPDSGSGDGGGVGLSGDAKAGIGVGAALGVILIGAGVVAIWYFEQRRQLRQHRLDVEERKLEAASGSTDGGGSLGRFGSESRLGPPTRGSSYRSDRHQQQQQHHPAGPLSVEGAAASRSGGSNKNGEVNTSTRNLNLGGGGGSNHHAGSIRSDVSGARAGSAVAGEAGRGSQAGDGGIDDAPPHLAHVATYIRRQQQFILDRCRQEGGGSSDGGRSATPPVRKPEGTWTGPTTITTSGGSDGATPTGHESIVSPWSATGPAGPSSSASLLGAASSSAHQQPFSELPVREGYQGYGPEYEMPSGAEGRQPPRPHRTPGQPAPHWGTDAAEQKFLLADMAAMKMRVLRPEDRTELP